MSIRVLALLLPLVAFSRAEAQSQPVAAAPPPATAEAGTPPAVESGDAGDDGAAEAEAAPAEVRRTLDVAVEEEVMRVVRQGFAPREEIIEYVVSILGDDYPADALQVEATRRTDKALLRRQLVERSWKSRTDCDRLEAAFAALEARGILARQNYEDCGTCGVGAIAAEMEEAAKAGRRVLGYTFFHMQDTESAADGGTLYLNYGAAEGGDEEAVAIGDKVVAELRRAGLEVKWDRDVGVRIAVVNLEWKRRRFTEAPAADSR